MIFESQVAFKPDNIDRYGISKILVITGQELIVLKFQKLLQFQPLLEQDPKQVEHLQL